MGIDVAKLATDLETLQHDLPKSMKETAQTTLKDLSDVKDGTIENLREQMDAAYKARNLTRLAISGIQVDDEKLLQVATDNLTNVESLGITPALIKNLAENIYKTNSLQPGQTVVIGGSRRNIEIIEEIARLCVNNDINFVIDIVNPEVNAILINNSDDEGLKKLAQERYDMHQPVKANLVAFSNPAIDYDAEKITKFRKAFKSCQEKQGPINAPFSAAMLPTKEDAKIDGIEYQKYLRLFFEACNQPWAAIEKAQAKLIEKLDKGKELKMITKDGTDLTIGIDGFTFLNSGSDTNIPGSEIFSAPEKDKITGTLVSKGNFRLPGSPIIKNITLKFVKGEITEAYAEDGQEALRKIIATDNGSKFIGEVAFGTNPHLRQHLVNTSLVEKIGGSFHLALGGCIELPPEGYKGQNPNIDNGNRSAIHWDITTLLKEGEVQLDGKVIQKNGIWVDENGDPDPDLAVLNYGWEAMPENERPPWWDEKYPDGYTD